MDKLLALQTFAVVADTGGFSKAAGNSAPRRPR